MQTISWRFAPFLMTRDSPVVFVLSYCRTIDLYIDCINSAWSSSCACESIKNTRFYFLRMGRQNPLSLIIYSWASVTSPCGLVTDSLASVTSPCGLVTDAWASMTSPFGLVTDKCASMKSPCGLVNDICL
jgi:hypothetical protein